MQTKNINLTPTGHPYQVVRVSQYDVGREININVTDGAEDYTIPSGSTVKFQGTKPSGLGFNEEVSYSGSVVTIVTKRVETDEAGRFPAELRISKNNVDIGVMNFHWDVERAAHTPETPDGSADEIIPELTLILRQIESDLETAEADIETMTELKDATETAAENAAASESAASQSASSASSSASSASSSKTAAETAKTAAETAKTGAEAAEARATAIVAGCITIDPDTSELIIFE